jgi:hypothetical protein
LRLCSHCPSQGLPGLRCLPAQTQVGQVILCMHRDDRRIPQHDIGHHAGCTLPRRRRALQPNRVLQSIVQDLIHVSESVLEAASRSCEPVREDGPQTSMPYSIDGRMYVCRACTLTDISMPGFRKTTSHRCGAARPPASAQVACWVRNSPCPASGRDTCSAPASATQSRPSSNALLLPRRPKLRMGGCQ